MTAAANAERQLRILVDQLQVYTCPETEQLWLHVNHDGNAEEHHTDHTFCPVAIKLAEALASWVKHSKPPVPNTPPPGYRLPTPAPPPLTQQYGHHCRCDPYGNEWETDHELGRVIHCDNLIGIDDSKIQSIIQRLYDWDAPAPPGFGMALSLTHNNDYKWYEMKTHKSKRHALLSRCSCCHPPKVMRIAWSRESSSQHMFAQRQHIQAWIGCRFAWMDGTDCCDTSSSSHLPCV